MWTLLIVGLVTSCALLSLVKITVVETHVMNPTQRLPNKPICPHDNCRFIGQNSSNSYFYNITGSEVVVTYESFNLSRLDINCKGSSVLSSVTPFLEFKQQPPPLRTLTLWNCSLLTGSLEETLTSLNYSSQYVTSLHMELTDNSLLTDKHFVGLENITTLHISAQKKIYVTSGVLKPLQNLSSLFLANVTLPGNELDGKTSLRDLELHYVGLKHLPEALFLFPLRRMVIRSDASLDVMKVPPTLQHMELQSSGTWIPLNETLSLETLLITRWTEQKPTPLVNCRSLRRIHLISPMMNLLPERWLTNCSNLAVLIIQEARKLTSLPSKLLFEANALTNLSFRSGALTSLPPGLLDFAPNLISLEFDNNNLKTLPNNSFLLMRRLQKLDLSSNYLTKLPEGWLNYAHDLLIIKINNNKLQKLPNGSFSMTTNLKELDLSSNKLASLQDGWLNRTSDLLKLKLNRNNLKMIPGDSFFGTCRLKELDLSSNKLTKMQKGWLNYTFELLSLNLNNNNFQTLPNNWFLETRRLQVLDLSSNALNNSVFDALMPLQELSVLHLSQNYLTDLCRKDGRSRLYMFKNLTKLSMNDNNLTLICKDWRENMTSLNFLDLSNTRVTNLTFEDFQFTRDVDDAHVLLLGVPVTINTTREDLNDVSRYLRSGATIHLNNTFECDCRMYWTRRALDLAPRSLQRVRDFTCSDGRLLPNVLTKDMMCADQEECINAHLPSKCTCQARPDGEPHRPLRKMVRVRCDNASLTHVPRPQPNGTTERYYELILTNNNIIELHADDLPACIKELDLRNNYLTKFDAETLKRLGSITGKLSLAGNPLACERSLLQTLRLRADKTDLRSATCSDGQTLNDAIFNPRPWPVTTQQTSRGWIMYMFTGLLGFALTVLACLATRERCRHANPEPEPDSTTVN